MKKEKVIVVLSGGVDSTTVLYDAINDDYIVEAISFDYGSKHNHKELPFAEWHCKKLNIPHKIIKLELDKYFKSSLLLATIHSIWQLFPSNILYSSVYFLKYLGSLPVTMNSSITGG